MCTCSYFIYSILTGIISAKIATLVGIAVAIIIYLVLIVLLKIFDEEEIVMIPYGTQIYKILQRLGICRKKQSVKNK